MVDNSLKEYYIQLQNLSNNNAKILNAISDSLKTYNSNVTLNFGAQNESIQFPSFLYLENKVEELETFFKYLINVPKNGEAWFSKDSDMYKLNVVHSNLLPPTPRLAITNNEFNVNINTLLKDLIFPKTSLRLNVLNLPNNIHELYVKKIVLYNQDLIDTFFEDNSQLTYLDFKEITYSSKNKIDYEEYDFNLSIPLSTINYTSEFNILEIKEVNYLENQINNNVQYKIKVDTLSYFNTEDESISYKLQIGDYLSLSSNYNIFQITNISENIDYDNDNNSEYIIELLETNGHTTLDTIYNNETMYFVLYNDNSKSVNKYVDIPLDNNQYSLIFISSIYNNVKSLWSTAIKINLNDLTIQENGTTINYLNYFDKYCVNLGSILTSFVNTLYIQPSEFTNVQLKELTSGKIIQQLVTNTLYKNDNSVLSITILNGHLVDDEISSNLSRLHKQKIEISNTLNNINTNIDKTFNQLTNTDFSQDTSITQTYLKSKLDSYYNERLTNQQQLISIINNIDLIKNDVIGIDELKYRVRGITNADDLDELGTESEISTYLHETYGIKCQLIGLEVEYKYQNIHSNSTTIENNNDTIFTDWVRFNNIDKQRYLKFDNSTNEYTIDYINYSSNLNVIKWNQIDLPIQAGENIVLRIRYKYNIGQPFINLYTPWSDNITVTYSDENTGNVSDIVGILQSNESDLNNSKFMSELINGGYQDHITNKIIDNSQVYYHLPENIYSGFNTAENKFISLKDKLIDIDKNINEYKEYINNELSSEYKVFLQDDKEQLIELTKNNINTINFQIENDNYESFIRKDLNLIIKNTGNTPINLYSIFPGNTDIPLIHSNIDYYIQNKSIDHYERVPLLLENISDIKKSIFPQVLGQWIYFRDNNIYTQESLYNMIQLQNDYDIMSIKNNEGLTYKYLYDSNFVSTNNSQMLLGFRNRKNNQFPTWNILEIDFGNNSSSINTNDKEISNNYFDDDNVSKFIYSNSLMKYEHVLYKSDTIDESNKTEYYLDSSVSINKNLSYYVGTSKIEINNLYGMFLIPNLLNKSQIICDNNGQSSQYKKLNVGESISIPILCEYFVNNENQRKDIYKTLAFTLQTSLTKDVDNYIMKVVISNKLKYQNILENNESTISLFEN